MNVADGKPGAIAPPPLQLAWLCGDYHLPGPGSILEQDYQLMHRMKALNNVHRTVSKFRSLTGEAVNTHLTTSERLMLGQLQKMGILGGVDG